MTNDYKYLDFYSKSNTETLILYPVIGGFINSQSFPVTFNVISSSDLKTVLEYYGYAQFYASITGDLILFESSKRSMDELIDNMWQTRDVSLNSICVSNESIRMKAINEISKNSLLEMELEDTHQINKSENKNLTREDKVTNISLVSFINQSDVTLKELDLVNSTRIGLSGKSNFINHLDYSHLHFNSKIEFVTTRIERSKPGEFIGFLLDTNLLLDHSIRNGLTTKILTVYNAQTRNANISSSCHCIKVPNSLFSAHLESLNASLKDSKIFKDFIQGYTNSSLLDKIIRLIPLSTIIKNFDYFNLISLYIQSTLKSSTIAIYDFEMERGYSNIDMIPLIELLGQPLRNLQVISSYVTLFNSLKDINLSSLISVKNCNVRSADLFLSDIKVLSTGSIMDKNLGLKLYKRKDIKDSEKFLSGISSYQRILNSTITTKIIELNRETKDATINNPIFSTIRNIHDLLILKNLSLDIDKHELDFSSNLLNGIFLLRTGTIENRSKNITMESSSGLIYLCKKIYGIIRETSMNIKSSLSLCSFIRTTKDVDVISVNELFDILKHNSMTINDIQITATKINKDNVKEISMSQIQILVQLTNRDMLINTDIFEGTEFVYKAFTILNDVILSDWTYREMLKIKLEELECSEHQLMSVLNQKQSFEKLADYAILSNIGEFESNSKFKDILLDYNFVYAEMFKRWYFLPSDGPYDPIILPNEYPYQRKPINGVVDKIPVIKIDPYTVDSVRELSSTHPIPNGSELANNEILVDIKILTNVIDFGKELWNANYQLYTRYTPSQAVRHFVSLIYDWLDKYIPNNVYKIPEFYPSEYQDLINYDVYREDYWRLYRWIRWYAEAIIQNVPEEELNNLSGNDYISLLIEDLIKYFNDHHGLYGVPGKKRFNKTKGKRHTWLTKNKNKFV